MFLDILEMIFDGISAVVSAYDVDLFSVGSINISFWELILGLLIMGIIFSFFLAPRFGSGLQGIGNLVDYNSDKKAMAKAKAEKEFNESYQGYGLRRARNEWYSQMYKEDMARFKNSSSSVQDVSDNHSLVVRGNNKNG